MSAQAQPADGCGTVMGVDIERGSSLSRAPRYAAAVYVGGEFVHHRHLTRHRLMRLIHRYRPSILACDSVHELASDRGELLALLNEMPAGMRVVQLTAPHSPSLPALASSHGLSIDRTDPVQEARACAMLAMLGVGYVVEAFEDKTVVVVSRARSLGRGGWSQNRYRRKVHGAVRAKAREIEAVLRQLAKSRGIEFEMKLTKGFGGYSRAEFVVGARREEVPISPQRHSDVQVKVRAVGRDRLTLTPLSSSGTPHIIVGIDPGTTMGLAALDLRGRLVGSTSERGFSPSDAIGWIRSMGIPVLIASDVLPVPHTVQKIANAFSVQCTGEQLTVEDKRRLSCEHEPHNDHERDAIAAASAAFRRVKNKLMQAEKKAPPLANLDYIKALVLKGESIDSAILKASERDGAGVGTREPQRKPPPTLEELSRLVERLKRRIESQRVRIERLVKYNEELKSELERQRRRSERLRRRLFEARQRAYVRARASVEYQRLLERHESLRRTLRERDAEIESLRERLDSLRRAREMEMRGDLVPLKPIRAFTREAIAESTPLIRKGDVLYLEDASGGGAGTAELLVGLSPRAVLFEGEMAHTAREVLLSSGVPLIRGEGLVLRFDEVYAVRADALEAAIEEWRSEHKLYVRRMHEHMLERIVEEYRSQRLREGRRG